MNPRMENIYQVSRFATEITLKITERVFNENTNYEPFIEVQKALETLKQYYDLEITETTHRKLKLKPIANRTITIKVKQTKQTPLEKHFRYKREPMKKPRYDWSQETYLRIKDPETMKRIKANRLIITHCKGQMNF